MTKDPHATASLKVDKGIFWGEFLLFLPKHTVLKDRPLCDVKKGIRHSPW